MIDPNCKGPIDFDKLASQCYKDLMHFDLVDLSRQFVSNQENFIKMYLEAAYNYGKNHAWWEEQEKIEIKGDENGV